jgi:hypothetical protein
VSARDPEFLVIAMSNRSICLVWSGGLIDDGGYFAERRAGAVMS